MGDMKISDLPATVEGIGDPLRPGLRPGISGLWPDRKTGSPRMVQDTAPPGPTKIRAVIVCSGGRNSEGGISRAMDYLATAFEQRPDAPQVRIVDPRGTGSLVWSPFFLMRAAAVVAWLFATAKADILHINVSVGGSTARKSIIALVARMVGAPYLVHIHSGRYHHFYRGLPGPVRTFTRRMLTRATRVVVLGAEWRAFVIDEVGIDPDRVVVMHNAVPGPAVIERREDASKPPKILFLGRLGQGKGVPELIEALATPRIAALSWTAVLAGDGDIEAYRTAAADRGIGDRIAFPGWVGPDTVRELLSSADIMVLPSHHEGLPMSVLEGMAYGLTVVSTPVGAIGEAIDNGVSGLLVSPGDVKGLTDALGRVISDADLRRLLSNGARTAFLEGFDVNGYATRMAALYAACLADSKH